MFNLKNVFKKQMKLAGLILLMVFWGVKPTIAGASGVKEGQDVVKTLEEQIKEKREWQENREKTAAILWAVSFPCIIFCQIAAAFVQRDGQIAKLEADLLEKSRDQVCNSINQVSADNCGHKAPEAPTKKPVVVKNGKCAGDTSICDPINKMSDSPELKSPKSKITVDKDGKIHVGPKAYDNMRDLLTDLGSKNPDEDANKLSSLLKDLNTKSPTSKGNGSKNVGFSGPKPIGGNQSVGPSASSETGGFKPRAPSSAGRAPASKFRGKLVRNYNGNDIGASNTDIFSMMNERYLEERNNDRLIKP